MSTGICSGGRDPNNCSLAKAQGWCPGCRPDPGVPELQRVEKLLEEQNATLRETKKRKPTLPLPVALVIGNVRIPVTMCNLVLPIGATSIKNSDGVTERMANAMIEIWLNPAEREQVAAALAQAIGGAA